MQDNVHFRKTNAIIRGGMYHLYNNSGSQVPLDQSNGEKDIGVMVDN